MSAPQYAFAERRAKTRELMNHHNMDALLVAVPENRYYLSGFEADDLALVESSGYLLLTADKQYLLTDSRYEEEAKHQAADFEIAIYTAKLGPLLGEILAGERTHRLGVEPHYLTHMKYEEVENALLEARPDAEIAAVEDLVEGLRWIKEPAELDAIKQSLTLSEQVLASVCASLQPGMTEKEIAWRIETGIREGGAEAVSFPPIAGSGPNGALPHAVPTDRRVAAGDAVVLDMGSRLNRYCSDITRTFVAGDADPKLKEIYRVVREAQLAGMQAAKAGVLTADVDAAARSIITDAGYGDYFGHGLGHGVGIAVHEKPGLRKTGDMVLQENMVVTIEPGIYLPGFQGVRLENMVVIKDWGAELMNNLDLFYQF